MTQQKFFKFLLTAPVIVFSVIAVLFFLLRATAYSREQLERHDTAPMTGKFVRAKDKEIYIQEAGPSSGVAVILIHGTGAWSEIWRATLDTLGEHGFHVIAIDLPPFGYSEKGSSPADYDRAKQAERIIGVLDALHISQAILVGHSVGGRPTLEAALKFPTRVVQLVLVDPALGFAVNSDVFAQNKPSVSTHLAFSCDAVRDSLISAYATNPMLTGTIFKSFLSKKNVVTPELIWMLQQPMQLEDTSTAYGDWLENLVTYEDHSIGSDFSSFAALSMPVVLIWGESDSITPLWQGEHLEHMIKNSTLRILPETGHIPYIESPQQFNQILLDSLHGSSN